MSKKRRKRSWKQIFSLILSDLESVSTNQWLRILVYFQLLYNFIIKWFIVDFHLPSFLNGVTDVINILLLVEVLQKIKKRKKGFWIGPLLPVIALLFFGTISFLLDFSRIPLYLYGLCDTYRFFAFFYCAVYILEAKDVKKIFRIMEIIFFANVLVCAYEFLLADVPLGRIGGLFGNSKFIGTSALHVLILFTLIYELVFYIYRKRTIDYFLFVLISAFMMAILSGLKIVYLEAILLSLLCLFWVPRNLKNMIALGSCVGLACFAFFIHSHMTFDIPSQEVDRFSILSTINDTYFRKNMKYQLVGMGLGNAEVSNYSFLQSDFYQQNKDFAYDSFTHSFLYLEEGYIGLALYVSFFLLVLMDAFSNRKKNKYFMIAFLGSLFALEWIVYDSAIRVETMGYFIFFVLAIPYILLKKDYLANDLQISFEKKKHKKSTKKKKMVKKIA